MVHHGAGLRRLLAHESTPPEAIDRLLEDLATDPVGPSIGEADRAMLVYALKLTRTPAEMNESDVATLRVVGFDDRAIHDICAVAAYYAFVNRIADGLGVELEQ